MGLRPNIRTVSNFVQRFMFDITELVKKNNTIASLCGKSKGKAQLKTSENIIRYSRMAKLRTTMQMCSSIAEIAKNKKDKFTISIISN